MRADFDCVHRTNRRSRSIVHCLQFFSSLSQTLCTTHIQLQLGDIQFISQSSVFAIVVKSDNGQNHHDDAHNHSNHIKHCNVDTFLVSFIALAFSYGFRSDGIHRLRAGINHQKICTMLARMLNGNILRGKLLHVFQLKLEIIRRRILLIFIGVANNIHRNHTLRTMQHKFNLIRSFGVKHIIFFVICIVHNGHLVHIVNQLQVLNRIGSGGHCTDGIHHS
mmetsp:Transcript_1255/g.1906  ORF Transcript_1255/g.1906 Transcript_1255/m.1906 type:complete len:221 (-) Transcript_1255:196-858(-)